MPLSGSRRDSGGDGSPVVDAVGRSGRRGGRLLPVKPAPTAQSFSVSEVTAAARQGRTRANSSRTSSEAMSESSESSSGQRTRESAAFTAARASTQVSEEPGHSTRSESHSQLCEQAEARREETDVGGEATTGHGMSFFAGGHVTCGVCGSRRYVPVPDLCYKFGSWICAHCIKFVLTTLKQASLAPTCLQDKELCRIHADKSELKLAPPDERCQACWLSACLNTLNFSKARYNRLRSSLPRAQRTRVPLFSEKWRRETGSCEYVPLATAAQPVIAPTPPAGLSAPLATCPDRAWSDEAVSSQESLEVMSWPVEVKQESMELVKVELADEPVTEVQTNTSETAPQREAESRAAEEASNEEAAERFREEPEEALKPERTVTRSRTQRWKWSPPRGVNSGEAMTVVPLGGGWERQEFIHNDGRLDSVVCSPGGTRFRSVVELQIYLRGAGITRKAQSFFTDGPPPAPPSPPESPEPAPPAPPVSPGPVPPAPPVSPGPVPPAPPESPGPAVVAAAPVKRIAPEVVHQDVVIRDSFVALGRRVRVECRSRSQRVPCGVGSPPLGEPARSPSLPLKEPALPGKENRTGERPGGWPANRLNWRPCLSLEQLRKRRRAAAEKSASRITVIKVEGGSMLRCVHCDYASLGQDQLDRHVKRRHGHIGRNGKHKCEWCDYSTDYLSRHTRHRLTHTGERPHRCGDCGRAFGLLQYLKRHCLQVHTGQRPYTYSCDVCGKAFTHSGNLTTHKRIHTGEKIRQCEQCGATFNQVASYTRHMKFHRRVKAHQCQVCSARFVTRQQLTMHTRSHTGERPYGCSFCSARFSRESNMNEHIIRRHTHDFRHRCGRCGKGFVGPKVLRRHEDTCLVGD